VNTFGELLTQHAQRNPKGISIVYGTQKITWEELNNRVNSLANALLDLGIRKGDKGIVMFHNCPEFVESTCALQKLGAIPSPMNYRFVPREIEYQTNHSDSVVFFTEELWVKNVREAIPQMPKVKYYICSGKSDDMLNYEELIKKYPSKEIEEKVNVYDVCALPYTGGTTGMPKGIVHTYYEFIEHFKGLLGFMLEHPINLPNLGQIKFTSIDEVKEVFSTFFQPGFLCVPPLFHMASFGVIMESLWIQMGSFPMVFPKNPRFDPKEVLEMIEKVKPAAVWMVPTMWSKLLEVPDIDRYDKSSLILLGSGGSICPRELKKRIFEHFPNTILIDAFGQSEMAPITTMRIDTSVEMDAIKDRAVGLPLSTVEVRVVNEKGEDVKRGEVGEIIYRSPTVMKEYYRDEGKTSAVFREGWFYSGDLGYFDEAGELIVVERKGEVISVGAEKIYPHEIEKILEEHPKIEHACLIGVPDKTYGKIPRAVIQLKEGEKATEEEIIEWCKDKMAGFKRPRSIIFTRELPLSPVGKVLRREIEKKYGGNRGEGR
jgi:acyl-CoA synthetase (AMP-forming)/AMP-acid ligase II